MHKINNIFTYTYLINYINLNIIFKYYLQIIYARYYRDVYNNLLNIINYKYKYLSLLFIKNSITLNFIFGNGSAINLLN